MRFAFPRDRLACFLAAFAVALLALLPLRLALGWIGLDRAGLSAREVRGSVWSGGLSEARFGDVPLGDLSAGFAPLPLAVGRARIDLRRTGDAGDRLDGALSVSPHSLGLDDLTAHLPVGERFAPAPMKTLDLADLSVRFRNGRCVYANGLVRAAIAGDIAGIALPGGLSGNARCAAGALQLPLASQSGLETVTLSIRSNGAYRAVIRVRPTMPAVRDALLASGFVPGAIGYTLTIRSSL